MSRSEAETRKQLIDEQLAKAGWDVKNPLQVVEEYAVPAEFLESVAEPPNPHGGFQFCDYVLLGKGGKPMAVVEAKRTSKDSAIGREQAKQYCHNIQKHVGGELPFCFYTNGLAIYFWIWAITHPIMLLVSPHEMTWSAINTFATIASRLLKNLSMLPLLGETTKYGLSVPFWKI